jgi:hypothetical protein
MYNPCYDTEEQNPDVLRRRGKEMNKISENIVERKWFYNSLYWPCYWCLFVDYSTFLFAKGLDDTESA